MSIFYFNRLIVFAYLIFLLIPAFSQKEGYRGIFGDDLELNFNKNPAEVSIIPSDPLFGQYFPGNEGVATISDRNGNLLFYTNGEAVWNNTFRAMPNGSDINGPPFGIASTSQSAIVPIPKDPFLYYVFTEGYQGGDARYSLVDMRRDNGLGDLVFKDSVLFKKSTEKVYAVKNAAGDGIWVITHEYGTNVFRSYLVNENGLDTNAVRSAVGEVHQADTIVVPYSNTFGSSATGYLEASPDGSRLACAVGGLTSSFLELFDFDKATGVVSNPIKIYDRPKILSSYGLEFSPDGSKLYFTMVDTNLVYQYDLDAGSAQDIINSATAVSHAGRGSLQLGPDGKIYVITKNGLYLDVINNPNGKGSLCDYKENGLYLLGNIPSMGLPEFTFPVVPPDIVYNKWCSGDSVQFELYKASHVVQALWNFGDPDSGPANQSTDLSPVHVFSKPGTYTIRADLTLDLVSNNTLTYEKNITIFETPKVYLGPDTFICNQGMITLWASPLEPGVQHMWQQGYGDKIVTDRTGNYWVKAYTDYCFSYDTVNVGARERPYFELHDTTLCFNQDLPVHLSYPYTTFTWNDGYKGSDRILATAGVYSVIGDAGYCGSYTDSFHLYVLPRLHVDLGKDTTLCQNGKINLNVQNDSATYLWNDHSTNPTYTVNEGGRYWVEIKNRCETVSDTLNVHKFELHDVFLPNLVTPNKDAYNDTFILNAPAHEVSMSFVNRWGDEIYHSERYGNDWPNEDISPGIYYYSIKEKCSNREFKGWVEILK